MLWAIGGASLLGLMALAFVARTVHRRAEPPRSSPPPPRPSLLSLHAERVFVRGVDRPRRICDRCRYRILHDHENDMCWLAVRQLGKRTALVHYHLTCADEYGEPLP